MIKTLLSNAPRMVEVSLLLLAGWWAFTLWQPNAGTSPSPTSMIPSNTEKTSLVSLKSLIAVPLFGKQAVLVVVKKPAIVPKPVAQTHLDIKLLGTVVAGERSAAIMTVGTSAETTFFLGDPLYGRVFLKDVKVNTVILSNQGVDERVSLSEGKAMVGGRISAPTRQNEYISSNEAVMNQAQPASPTAIMNQGFPPNQ